jgi:hypothetical protein
MTEVSEIAEYENAPQEVRKQSKLAWGLTVARLLLRNPGALKKLMVMGPDEPRYVRPPRAYELPAYRQGVKYCKSNEKYLRPTRWCNPREPEVIAMANELGAYKLSDYEFAEAAYWLVKTKFAAELVTMNSVSATLKRGTGTCFHLNSLWIALCRAAGIKARYKRFTVLLHNVTMNFNVTQIMDLDETELALLPDLLNIEGAHAESEACIDGKWVVADVSTSPEMQAHSDVPITMFGEDAIGSTFEVVPGTKIEHVESLPSLVGIALRAQSLFRVVRERGNVVFAEMVRSGRKIIEEAGGIEAYNQSVRRKRELLATDEITRQIKEAERPQFVEFKG